MSSSFVSIKGQSIRVSNIKAFGVKCEEVEPQPQQPKPQKKREPGTSNLVAALDLITMVVEKFTPETISMPQEKPQRYYLYVTSFQGDNHRFYGDKAEVDRYHEILQDALLKK
ncbi:hypothetical protein [Aeromonas caviae]|uniref:hypothetical protein n=1 Tax=Aeromonas caviae TaxID=648 RepID=UPI00224C9FBE|nr:hypothetical protein [Aeromonas caviae]MCX4037792.1 hypothetical protein [Aeromonas caviae]MDX7949515.1 hypothetical protein [Aeromonas caviae]